MGIGSSEETGSRITCTIIATGFPTGTQVLPSDKPELVKYNLEGNDSQGAADAAPAPLEASVVTEHKERVVMDLEDVAPENQAPTFETNEVVEDIEDAVNTTTETEGFPQQPDEDIEATFEGALENEGLEIEEDETPMVHVLEWDMEDESDEATEAIEQAVDESHIDSETVNEGDSPTLAGGWDLFTQDELVEEEMELTFVDEDEAEEILSEEDEAIGSYSEDVFDAEAPPKMERLELEETEALSEEVVTAADASSENVQSIGEERRFTLEDIEGDGFTLEIEELETPQESSPSNDSIEDTQYDPFDLSLSDMPELKQKAEQESMESSFTLVSKEFELEPQAGLPMTETDTLEEADPALHFQIKESDAPAAKGAPKEEETFDMDQPLSEMPRRPLSDLPSKIQDRMSRLQSFQYQFKANLQNLSDAERVPAYLRQGMEVDLDQKSNEQPSNIGVDNDGNIRTNNSFLHDNVD
jgi:cell division protein FtsZ